MVERLVRNEEVSGSIPLGSTKSQEKQQTSGGPIFKGSPKAVWISAG